jgi:hypothetical protein|tara:strand:+ start:959 stop:1618 length:660 start_codon:yes stop_codon:yes gene_type:complete
MFDAKDDNTATVTITEKNPKQSNPMKWIALALGTVLGVSHISLIGLLANKKAQLPNLNLPVSEYSSYEATVSSDGYKVRYNSNDPKVLERTQSLDLHQDIDKPGGLFGGGREMSREARQSFTNEQYTMEGTLNMQGGPLPKLDGSTGSANQKSVACIEAVGGGKQTGRVVGASVGAGVASSVIGIPYIGPVLGGLVAIFTQDKGSEIGGKVAEGYSKDC